MLLVVLARPIVCRPHPRPKGRGNWILTTIAAQDFSINKEKHWKKATDCHGLQAVEHINLDEALAKIAEIKFEQLQKALKKVC